MAATFRSGSGRRPAARPRCGPVAPAGASPELGTDVDEHLLDPPDVGDDVDRLG